MRILVNINNEFCAYESNCIEYINSEDSPKGQGLYIETNDRNPDAEWLLVPMEKATAYDFIRKAVLEGFVDLSSYDTFEVNNDVVDTDSYSISILDDYFEKMNIMDDNDRAVEFTRLSNLFGTDDIDVVAENVRKNLM